MRYRILSLVIAMLVSAATAAYADRRDYVVKKEGASWTCSADKRDPNAESGKLLIVVAITGAGKATEWSMAFGTNKVALQATPAAPGTLEANAALTQIGSEKVSLTGKVDDQVVNCGAIEFSATPLQRDQAEGDDAALRVLDAAAQEWLLGTAGASAKEALVKQLPKRVVLLIHLPSGRAAAPARPSLSERDDYQLAIVIDRKMTASWMVDRNVTTCTARDEFRIKGDFKGVDIGPKQGAAVDHNFALLPIERPLSCGADRMEYTLQVSAGSIKGDAIPTAWTIRPVYHLAATVGLGFDGGKRRTFAALDGKIAESTERIGSQTSLGFTWFPGGVEYGAMRGVNYWLNPFLLFDLNAPKENFVFGTAITPTGGISIGIGMSLHRETLLKSGTVGDAFTGDGDVPTRTDWTKNSKGWYIGVLFDTNVFKAVKSVLGTVGS